MRNGTLNLSNMTIKAKVLNILREKGQIDNYFAIDSRLTIRLGDVIFRLQKEGKIELDEERCGYIDGTKNWLYVIKPIKKQEYFVQGIKVAERFL